MNRKEQIRTLWQVCFDGSEASLDYYFDRVYTEEHAVSIEKDGQVVSALQMLPYRMRWCGTEIPVSYIYAACTAPEERGRGLMRDLLLNAFAAMREQGILFSFLIPANPGLFTYYRTQGYTEVFDCSTTLITETDVADAADVCTCVPLHPSMADEWYPYFHEKENGRSLTVLHTPAHLHHVVTDTLLYDGLVLGLQDEQGNKKGLVFVSEEEGVMQIRELFYESEEAKRQLLREVLKRLGTASIKWVTPPQWPDTQRMGMGIVLDPAEMIRLWAIHHHASAEIICQLGQMGIRELTAFLLDYPHRTGCLSLMPD